MNILVWVLVSLGVNQSNDTFDHQVEVDIFRTKIECEAYLDVKSLNQFQFHEEKCVQKSVYID